MMADGIYTAMSGQLAQLKALDQAANNIANAGTTGFRGDKAVFHEVLANARGGNRVDPRQPPSMSTDRFVRFEGNVIDSEEGLLKQTGNALDLALQGGGFFQVRTAAGDRLTRAGNFQLDRSNILVTQAGDPVLSAQNTPIVIPADARSIVVRPDGVIQVDGVEYAALGLRAVRAESQLRREGANLFALAPGANAIEVAANVTVHQGYIESSNVSGPEGLDEITDTSRAFAALQRVIQSFEEVDKRTSQEIGGRR